MPSINKVILIGRLGADPELRYTPDGKPVCNLSLATNRTYFDKANNQIEKVNWHRVIAWGRQGELCKEHLAKGRQIYVEGRIENHSYTDKAGERRFTCEIISHNIIFLDRSGVNNVKQSTPLENGEYHDDHSSDVDHAALSASMEADAISF